MINIHNWTKQFYQISRVRFQGVHVTTVVKSSRSAVLVWYTNLCPPRILRFLREGVSCCTNLCIWSTHCSKQALYECLSPLSQIKTSPIQTFLPRQQPKKMCCKALAYLTYDERNLLRHVSEKHDPKNVRNASSNCRLVPIVNHSQSNAEMLALLPQTVKTYSEAH